MFAETKLTPIGFPEGESTSVSKECVKSGKITFLSLHAWRNHDEKLFEIS